MPIDIGCQGWTWVDEYWVYEYWVDEYMVDSFTCPSCGNIHPHCPVCGASHSLPGQRRNGCGLDGYYRMCRGRCRTCGEWGCQCQCCPNCRTFPRCLMCACGRVVCSRCSGCGRHSCLCQCCLDCERYPCTCDEETCGYCGDNPCDCNRDKVASVCPVCKKERDACTCPAPLPKTIQHSRGRYPHFNPRRAFAVEIECFDGGGRGALERRLNELAGEYHIEDSCTIEVDTDGSIRGARPTEVKLGHLRGDVGLSFVHRVVRCIAARGYAVNESCGLHVHHAINRQVGVKVYGFYSRYQPFISGLLRQHRNGNGYCENIPQINYHGQVIYDARYQAVNWITSYESHRTIEFRQHHATLSANAVVNWILLTQLMVEAADGTTKSWRTFDWTNRKDDPDGYNFWRSLIDPKDELSVSIRRYYLAQAKLLSKAERRPAVRFSPLKKKG